MCAAMDARVRLTDDLSSEDYAEQGLHYYLLARQAAFFDLNPAAGLTFAHAVEMLLKASLVPHHPVGEIKKLLHHLDEAWEKFKLHTQDPAVSAFDPLIAEWNRWWPEVRYPDLVKKDEYLQLFIVLHPADVALVQRWSRPGAKRLVLSLADCDRFVQYIVKSDPLYTHALNSLRLHLPEEALELLSRYNQSPLC
jgi:hypothetical protein